MPAALLLLLVFCLALTARAELQFDVFIGYDGVVPEASWFPMVCEVKNDGPPFVGIIEVTPGGFNESQTRRAVVELPTGTLKRLVIPVFSTTRYQGSWDVRLLDEHGHVHDEKLNLRPQKQLPSGAMLLGALPRTANGVPVFKQVSAKNSEMQPVSARLETSIFPDNPLVLEGMRCFYLNSDRATDLTVNQVNALLAWLNAGGHLIVAVEQPSDVNGLPWLRKLLPCDLTDEQSVTNHAGLQQWLVGNGSTSGSASLWGNTSSNPFLNLPGDTTFEAAPLQIVVASPRNGQVLTTADGVPLMITSREGRGEVTALLFSPEREPVRSWKHLPAFWARLANVQPQLYDQAGNENRNGGWSIDGVFGAMIDSRQVRKLPVQWLLLLLIVYLVVIGPLDQYWLKKIRRPMLTWVTFPCYVVLFSVLIYFIGYKLRAGESEWNELHVVDVLTRGGDAELRGRTYASIYSPVNARYRLGGQQDFSTLRGEFQSSWNGGQDSESADVTQNGDNFKAVIDVPVWTSQLYVSDWWQSGELPMEVTVLADGVNWDVTVNNHLDRALSNARLAVGDRLLNLGDLPAGQSKEFHLRPDQGTSLQEFVRNNGGSFQSVIMSRQNAFGRNQSGRIEDLPDGTVAASFISGMSREQSGFEFISPPGMDLTPNIDRGDAVLFAWSPDYSPANAINEFSPRRSHKNTLWRMSVPVVAPNSP